ncbi:MAG: hypothetical protein H0V01_10580 [Bacteroidetes bacterium]|nr:hypothetical protein [Bacteroidota bacterium]HET6243138.1 hypothetical protein [Bacteroidia bacterium]
MTIRKTVKASLLILSALVFIAGGIAYYFYNLPHRDVHSAQADYSYDAGELVNEYLSDPIKANEKYLDGEGESKILQVSGPVVSISEDFKNQKVIRLKPENGKAGVSCTFTEETNDEALAILVGQTITVKGVIRIGAAYDEDLERYEDVILEKCSLIKINN